MEKSNIKEFKPKEIKKSKNQKSFVSALPAFLAAFSKIFIIGGCNCILFF